MTVCEYFLQGRCRFWQNCRFSHVYDERSNRNAVNTQHISEVIKQIVNEVILAEKGGQWPLSCFSPVKEGPNIPGLEDVSFEEVRWKMYEARAKGTLDQCIIEIKHLYENAEKQRNILKQPTMERINLIVDILKGKKEVSNQQANPFASSSSRILGSSGQSTGSHGSIFGGTSQSTGSHGSIFGGTSQSTGSHGSIFGGSGQASSQGNVFAGSPQPLGQQGNIFASSTPQSGVQGNIFSGNFTNQNVFGGTTSTSTFSQNLFGNPQTSNQNVFSQASLSGSGNIFSNSTSSQNIFSNSQAGNQGTGANAFSSPIFPSQGVQATPIFGSKGPFFSVEETKPTNIFAGNQSENIFQSQNSLVKNEQSFNPQNGDIFRGQGQSIVSGNQQRPNALDSSVYSKVEDLSEEEKNYFTAKTFVFGKIPLKPPPQEYCN